MTKYLLDTNVLLRFLLGDHEHSPIAAKLFHQAVGGKCSLVLTDVAIAEAVWVLTSHYKVDRQNTANKLLKVIDSAGVTCPNREVLCDALTRFKNINCDFFDCYLAAMASVSGYHIASFDSGFRKFKDVRRWHPQISKSR